MSSVKGKYIQQGREARARGKSYIDNPYTENSLAWKWWNVGWHEENTTLPGLPHDPEGDDNDVVVVLTPQEVKTLSSLLASIGGPKDGTPRKQLDNISNKLRPYVTLEDMFSVEVHGEINSREDHPDTLICQCRPTPVYWGPDVEGYSESAEE